jgi:hypothetical protein
MPYVFAIDIIFITNNSTIRTLCTPLGDKGILFDSDVGIHPIIMTHPVRYQEFNEIINRTFKVDMLRIDRIFYRKINSFDTIFQYIVSNQFEIEIYFANADDYVYGVLVKTSEDKMMFLPFEIVPRKNL